MLKRKKTTSVESHIIILLLLFFIIMLSFAIYLLSWYRGSLVKQTTDMATAASVDFVSEIDAKINTTLRQTVEVAAYTESLQTEEDIMRYFGAVPNNAHTSISFLRPVIKGSVYNSLPTSDTQSIEPQSIMKLIEDGSAGCSGLIYDHGSYTSLAYVAFFAPIHDNAIIDGVISYSLITRVFDDLISFKTDSAKKAEYLALCTTDGTIILQDRKDAFPDSKLTNLYQTLREISNNLSLPNELSLILKNTGLGSTSFKISGEDYSIAIVSAPASDNTLHVATIYRTSELHSTGFSFVANISVTLLVLLLVIAAGIAYLSRINLRNIEKIRSYDNINPILKCNTFKKFSIDTEDILTKNKITKFALIYIEINRFRFITESYDSINADDILRFLTKIISMSLVEDETYGHINDDKFALLLHYSDEEELMRRLRVIYAIAFNYPELKKQNLNLKLSLGVYCIDRTIAEPIPKMLDRAIIAQKTNTHTSGELINIYDERVKTSFMREAEIETVKESALANNEFRVFYQPKYNIAQNRPEGAEALVRWYDAKTNTFRNPDEFVPIFETNGFISKVDRYVFSQVCKYLSESVERGHNIVPISINVSRVTATQKGFVEFYTNTKKKYNISDNYLTVEFTESFAYENYEELKNIIKRLKHGGILSSIDDFGSGYSSYNTLKELQVDELKLDRFFITKGISQERDDELLRSIITLAKNFGMRVVQEGVETPDSLERLKRFGCDVIQGYFYSKPLVLDDFIAFLSSGGTMHRY